MAVQRYRRITVEQQNVSSRVMYTAVSIGQ
jgi:hypothetical protein